MVAPGGEQRKQAGLMGVFLCLVVAVFFATACSTETVPVAPEPESRKIPIQDIGSDKQFLKAYSNDFQKVYKSDAPWTRHMLVYLSVRFLARDGLTKYQSLSRKEKDVYPGVGTFVGHVKKEEGPWRYTASLALSSLRKKNKREAFRSDLNFRPFQNFAIGKWIRNRLSSGRPLPDFSPNHVEKEFYQPILKSMALVLAAQYYLRSYQSITEPTVLDEFYHQDMSWMIQQWNENYLRVRSIWKPQFDLTVLSSDTMRPLYEPAEEHPQPIGGFWEFNPADRSFGRSTLPYQEVYDVPMENIIPRVRDLQTEAIQEYIHNRLHSSLRYWLKLLTYALKFRFYEEINERKHKGRSDVDFYARSALQDINNIIQMN